MAKLSKVGCVRVNFTLPACPGGTLLRLEAGDLNAYVGQLIDELPATMRLGAVLVVAQNWDGATLRWASFRCGERPAHICWES